MNIGRSLRRAALGSIIAVALLPAAAAAQVSSAPDAAVVDSLTVALVQVATTGPPDPAALNQQFSLLLDNYPGVTCDVAVTAINRARLKPMPRLARQQLAALIWNLPACAGGSAPMASRPDLGGPGLGPTGGGSDYTGT